MSVHANPNANPLHTYGRSGSSTRHSKDRALTEREFELLLEAAKRVAANPQIYDPEPEMMVYVMGRLGLRRGELVHLQEDWIDWREKMIRIPAHSPCSKGRDGGRCGMCRQLAAQRLEYNDELDLDDAVAWMWTPKTEAGVRDVYFGHDVRAEMLLERYFAPPEIDQFLVTGSSVSRRIDRIADEAEEIDAADVHPHGLRATAATHMASSGLGTYAITQFFGWERADVAERYIARNSTSTARQLEGVYTRR